jgi:Tfp pilus assembly protein PilX
MNPLTVLDMLAEIESQEAQAQADLDDATERLADARRGRAQLLSRHRVVRERVKAEQAQEAAQAKLREAEDKLEKAKATKATKTRKRRRVKPEAQIDAAVDRATENMNPEPEAKELALA